VAVIIIILFSFEKMISDKYQGRIVCLVLKDLIRERALFGGKSSPKFDKFEAFSTGRLSTMEGWYVMYVQ
jgi:hexokinase